MVSVIGHPWPPRPETIRVPGWRPGAKIKAPLKRGLNLAPGSDLLSQPVARQVPSAQRGLTAVFGMGTGGSPSVWPPGKSRRSLLVARRSEYDDNQVKVCTFKAA